jgi:hypothetical protein
MLKVSGFPSVTNVNVCDSGKIEHQSVVRECIQNFPDWPPGARTVNGTALCH